MMSAIDMLLEASGGPYGQEGSTTMDSIESKVDQSDIFHGHGGDALDAILLLAGHAGRLRAASPSNGHHGNAYNIVHGIQPEESERPNYRRSRAMSEPWSMSEFALSQSVLRDCDQSVPDFVAKYSDVINKNGRIGIYTKEERVAIIARFREKKKRRVWQKKIRYTCRKSLADRRLRVKGRFVKMAPSEAGDDGEGKLRALANLLNEFDEEEAGDDDDEDEDEMDVKAATTPAAAAAAAAAAAPSQALDESTHPMVRRPRRPSEAVEDDNAPYKRVRRHSIAF